MPDHGEAFDMLVKDRHHRFGRHIAPGQTGSARGDDGIHLRVCCPVEHLLADGRGVITQQDAIREDMTIARHAFRQNIPGCVIFQRTGVRHRQHRNPDRLERPLGNNLAARGRRLFDNVCHGLSSQLARAFTSVMRGSIQRSPAAPISFFQNGASVLR